MQAFASTNELYVIMRNLWNQIKANKKMSDQLLRSRLIVRFKYRDPDGQLTIDGSNGKELEFYFGDCNLTPDVEMSMKSDVANQFWLGGLNVPAAMLAGRIASRGPVHRALALLPVVKPAFSIYRAVRSNAKGKAA